MSAIVEIEGKRFHQFVSLSVQRSKEAMTASGNIILSWPGAEMFNATTPPAQEMVDGAKGTITLDGKLAATVRIDKRSSQGSASGFTLSLSFRGLAAALVDSSADHPSGQENDKAPGDIARTLMEGYESELIDKSSEKRPLKRFVISDGETVQQAIRRSTREFGLVAYENEEGNVVLDSRESDEGEGQQLVLGRNFTQWSVNRDIAPRYSKVTAKGSSIPTDEKYGQEAEDIAGAAIDNYVQYKRELHILVESDQDVETLKTRALTEARRRAAKGLTIDLTLSSWTDDDGELWKVGRLHHVVIPVDQVDTILQISSVSFDLSAEDRSAKISLVPREAFASIGKAKDKGKAASKKGGDTRPIYDLNINDEPGR